MIKKKSKDQHQSSSYIYVSKKNSTTKKCLPSLEYHFEGNAL